MTAITIGKTEVDSHPRASYSPRLSLLSSSGHRNSSQRRKHRDALKPRGEWLELRLALSTTSSAVVMDAATTIDSKSVTVEYEVSTLLDARNAPSFRVYRSADQTFSPDDLPVSSAPIMASSLDDNGQPLAAMGHHQLTISLPEGLPLSPRHPYVLVVANPESVQPGQSPPTASFRKYTIGVVTHGGIENRAWKNGPVWELVMARSLKQHGYDAVIPFNWVSQSGNPGAAPKQGPRLAKMVLKAASLAPSNEPVDLHFIGHSEGTVVNTMAIVRLELETTPQLKAGYLEDTLLDPHAANNGIPGQQYSIAGIFGPLADAIISVYQSNAHDPSVSIPAVVNQAEVFYQHTPATSSEIYNLWGQVPVRGSASYFNVTASGATHSGKKGIAAWYQNNVVPTLGEGAQELRIQTLQGKLDSVARANSSGIPVVNVAQPRYTGSAGPGSIIRLYAGPAGDPSIIALVGQTIAGSDGIWSATTGPLADGHYRIVAVSTPPARHTPPRFVMNPTLPLGRLDVDTKPMTTT